MSFSSDSEDDCYGSVALKLQKKKNLFKTVLHKTSIIKPQIEKDCEEVVVLDDKPTPPVPDEDDHFDPALEAIIAQNPVVSEQTSSKVNRRMTRSNARKSNIQVTEPSLSALETAQDGGERRRGRRGGRGNKSPRQSMKGNVSAIATTAEQRGRRGRGRRSLISNNLPIYSIGNTFDYPDQSEDVELFSSKPKEDEVIEIDANISLDDNEELSVKVYWQSYEIFKFKIRRYQKLQQIFEFFSMRENVGFENLLFTYNSRLLKPDDTPDDIAYNIAKFIDGGVVNKDITRLAHKGSVTTKNGIKIKFQCQNQKKPYETTIDKNEKLALAMLKFAEYLEKPLSQLKFVFDGETVSSQSTPNELDFEGDECIDVRIVS